MDMTQDPIDNSKLPYKYKDGYTIHFILDENGDFRTHRWSKDRELGEGGFGQVWREVLSDRDNKTGLPANKRIRAVKKVSKTKVPDQTLRSELKAIMYFSQAKYRDLFVESYGWFDTSRDLFITMEYLENGDLSRYLKGGLPILEAKMISVQILKGLWHMHRDGFTHRDLKPENLLVVSTQPWKVKIADFGLCKQVLGDLTSLRTNNGTPAWKAPEYFFLNDPKLKLPITNSVDIWSFGAIVFNMLTGQRPFHSELDIHEYERGSHDPLETDLGSYKGDSDCVNFLKRTMAPKPEHRLAAYACLRHPWLDMIYREDSNSLTPVKTTDSSSTSPNPVDNPTALSRRDGKISEMPPNIDSSLASATWDFLDRTKTNETAELRNWNTNHSVFKSSTLSSNSQEYKATSGSTARDAELTGFPSKGSKASVLLTQRPPTRHPKSHSHDTNTIIAPLEKTYASPRTSNSFQGLQDESLVEEAANLYHNGKWDDLVVHMRALIRIIGPNNPEYSKFLGMLGLALLFSRGQEQSAEATLDRAKKASKENRLAGLNYLLARACFRQKKDYQGSVYLRQALDELLQEPQPDQELVFEYGSELGHILLRDSRTKSEGQEMLKNVQQQCYKIWSPQPVGIKAFAAKNSHYAWYKDGILY